MDFSSLEKHFDMSKLKIAAENAVFNYMIASQADSMDVNSYMALQSIIAAFNKRGVSTKITIEALVEAFGGGKDE